MIHFSAHLTVLERATAKGCSVCLSVCPSVILAIHRYTVPDIVIRFVPTLERYFSFDAKFRSLEFTGSNRTSVIKRDNPPHIKSKNLQ